MTNGPSIGPDEQPMALTLDADLPATGLPLALADRHRTLAPGQRVTVELPGALAGLASDHLRRICIGAGFTFDDQPGEPDPGPPGRIPLVRAHTLADTVGTNMRLLVCGLNPSPASAETGVGFARPGNRFWPAALAAGIVTRDRDPRHALTANGVGMTDLVKRTTRTAAELSREEYRSGLDRIERLIEWLQPTVVCFVGLAGWRAAVDRQAVAGAQPGGLAGRPVHLMPSTSGLNAHSTREDLTDHLRQAAELGKCPIRLA
ncbi:MAG: mismatch-specific DNA-glycosylase [Actinomycetota bacterium]